MLLILWAGNENDYVLKFTEFIFMYSELSTAAHVAYQRVLKAFRMAENFPPLTRIPGSFTSKLVSGNLYWYLQYKEPDSRLRQVYIGLDSPTVRSLIKQKNDFSLRESFEEMALSAHVLGCKVLAQKDYRVIERLADYGFFRKGGVLVGYHAFVVYGNMLGVKWDSKVLTNYQYNTFDENISVAVSLGFELGTTGVLNAFAEGRLPVRSGLIRGGRSYLTPWATTCKVQLLTPAVVDQQQSPGEIEGLSVTPIPYLDYLLEAPSLYVLLGVRGAVLVGLASPTSYALFQLIKTGATGANQNGLFHAARILTVLRLREPLAVQKACLQIFSRGPSWARLLTLGIEELVKNYPDQKFREWLGCMA